MRVTVVAAGTSNQQVIRDDYRKRTQKYPPKTEMRIARRRDEDATMKHADGNDRFTFFTFT